MSTSRPITPAHGMYSNIADARDPSLASRPQYSSEKPQSYLSSGRPATSGGVDTAQGAPKHDSILSQSVGMHDSGFGVNGQDDRPDLIRADSALSNPVAQPYTPSRQGTLKKRASLKRQSSMKRTLSRRSSRAGSVRSLNLGDTEAYEEHPDRNSAFYCPVPTTGNPTEVLANRFQAWRAVLKNLINYFRDIQKSYDTRSKSLQSASNVINNTSLPSNFLQGGGLGDANYILRDFHKQALTEATKSRDVQNEIIMQLTGLRSDLQQKIKEIKGLSGDFKNSVEKEQNNTRSAISQFQEAVGLVDRDAAATSGKGDPFIVKQGVDRQLARQIEEENYLHRAYLNLESSGRELESIVVGEIQKAYNAYATILQREANESFETAERLKGGPLALAKDHEWDSFVSSSQQMVDPRAPVRDIKNITYQGRDHPAAIEVKSGMLERKSKYLKNYTPGWYILSPTHLHEFKSADRISTQTPVMSLYLPEQKLGSHSEPGSSSHKFMLKGSQTGGMHRGHAWVFRAESHDTMMAWFGDIKELTEKRGEARNEFVRRTHARSLSGNQKPPSIVSGNSIMQEDEADAVPYSSEQSVRGQSVPREGVDGAYLSPGAAAALDDNRSEAGWRPPPQRPSPGGRFPSNVDVNRGLAAAPLSPSSAESDRDRDIIADAGALPGSDIPFDNTGSTQPHTQLQGNDLVGATAVPSTSATYSPGQPQQQHPQLLSHGAHEADSQYGEWMAPIAGGTAAAAGGAALGAGAMHHHLSNNDEKDADGVTAVAAASTTEEQHDRSLSRPRGLTESTQATATTHAASQYGAGASSVGGATLSTVPTSVAAGNGIEVVEEADKPTAPALDASAAPIESPPVVLAAANAIPAGVDARHAPVETTAIPAAVDARHAPVDTTTPAGTAAPRPDEIAMPPPPPPAAKPLDAVAVPVAATTLLPSALDGASGARTTASSVYSDAGGVLTGADGGDAVVIDAAKPTDFVVRPTLLDSGGRAKSVQTISDLHVPGEFPKQLRGSREGSESFE